jgi:putative PIN family toxin of toxin-antitoxin system
MKRLPRVLLDTNVFISSFVFKKALARIAKAWEKNRFIWILSPEIQQEYLSVISRPKFRQTQEEIVLIFDLLSAAIEIGVIKRVIPKGKLQVIHDDPKDNIFLECAVAGNADYIITGDQHLLRLRAYRKIKIISPRAFVDLISKRELAKGIQRAKREIREGKTYSMDDVFGE